MPAQEPQASDAKYQPKLGLLDKVVKTRTERKTKAAHELFVHDHASWIKTVESMRVENERRYAEKAVEAEQWNRESQEHQEALAKKDAANRGILVTTSDYGPDSYEFAKGKPLVLLNGANLLNLLGKHGHKAKIDLKEAKTILAAQ
jgi:hypothetical protein